MANVKISELPALGQAGTGDDVIIVNSAASNTTCKSTLTNLLVKNYAVSGEPNTQNGALVWTQNGNPFTTFNVTVNRITPTFARVRMLSGSGAISINNTSNAAVQISLSTGLASVANDVLNVKATWGGNKLVAIGQVSTNYDVSDIHWVLNTVNNPVTADLWGEITLPNGATVHVPMGVGAGETVTMNIVDISFYAYSTTTFQ